MVEFIAALFGRCRLVAFFVRDAVPCVRADHHS
ncbi:MAG: hypothetical protein ACI8W7_003414 [Gammaproteobacteria bacterium]|jgi:hypothetical protein